MSVEFIVKLSFLLWLIGVLLARYYALKYLTFGLGGSASARQRVIRHLLVALWPLVLVYIFILGIFILICRKV